MGDCNCNCNCNCDGCTCKSRVRSMTRRFNRFAPSRSVSSRTVSRSGVRTYFYSGNTGNCQNGQCVPQYNFYMNPQNYGYSGSGGCANGMCFR